MAYRKEGYISRAYSEEENCISSDDCPSKLHRRLTTSYSAVVAATHRVM